METINKVELSKWFESTYLVNNRSFGKRKLKFGIGINDANYITGVKVNGKLKQCPCYIAWSSMLKRAYSAKFSIDKPTYKDVTVCDKWLTFSNFREWWLEKYKEGYSLDKDILVFGNKCYSPETCVYVPIWLNNFILDNSFNRGKYKIGTYLDKDHNKFRAQCNHPITNKQEHLGFYDNEDEAHKAWLSRKLQIANELRDMMDEIDIRIFPAIINNINSK